MLARDTEGQSRDRVQIAGLCDKLNLAISISAKSMSLTSGITEYHILRGHGLDLGS